MQRLQQIDPKTATGPTKELLDAVKAKFGRVPALPRTFANSPALLKGYLGLSGALSEGVLSEQLREQISLAVSEANGCDYCVAAHTAVGKLVGLSEEQTLQSRKLKADDSETAAALTFVGQILEKRGWVDDEDFENIRSAGYSDEEIAEIIGVVALNFLNNYFNHAAGTEIDFPTPPTLA